jgi:hypothetical protein
LAGSGKGVNYYGYEKQLARYPAIFIRQAKSTIQPDTGYEKRPDYPAGYTVHP